jgi:hypothetical protein
MRAKFLSATKPLTNLKKAQQALDERVEYYNTARPHQSLQIDTLAHRFGAPSRFP